MVKAREEKLTATERAKAVEQLKLAAHRLTTIAEMFKDTATDENIDMDQLESDYYHIQNATREAIGAIEYLLDDEEIR